MNRSIETGKRKRRRKKNEKRATGKESYIERYIKP
jgi:hypothetical protein